MFCIQYLSYNSETNQVHAIWQDTNTFQFFNDAAFTAESKIIELTNENKQFGIIYFFRIIKA